MSLHGLFSFVRENYTAYYEELINWLFDGYTAVFDAQALGSSTNAFALEAFRSNPLVAIQHDGDLSKIEDNTRLNSLVSHERMRVNEKFKSTYESSFNALLFMGTNNAVKITDAQSGLLRRLIDVSPTGDKLPGKEYKAMMNQVKFELGAIAYRCREAYLSDPSKYDDYVPICMLGASNDFYNFILDSWPVFRQEDETTLKAAWEMYKTYCEEAKVKYPYAQRSFKEELKNYFKEYGERITLPDGTRIRSHYKGFRADKFESASCDPCEGSDIPNWLRLKKGPSKLDEAASECKAQYAGEDDKPTTAWANAKETLMDIDTSRVHYFLPPKDHVVIDFDLKDEFGQKSLEKNLEAARKFPPTYAEVSKGGAGLHLHYTYTGDISLLSYVYDDQIEVKLPIGNSSIRRKLTLCNDLTITSIGSGLPLKEGNKTVNFEGIKSEKALRTMIKRNLGKEYHSSTKPSVDFIHKILGDAYLSDMHYDVTDMRPAVLAFAAGSTNQAEYCVKLVNKMAFKSKEVSPSNEEALKGKLIFFDVEVFPNLFLVNWKMEGEGKPVVRMINPEPVKIEELLRFPLVGFNCRRYDNHMLYARLMGYSNEQLYNLSQRIIGGSANCFFGEAYNLSYTDVFDFSSKKQSLKKFEIELGIHHKELGLPWDEPVPESLWGKVAEYCDNDVLATEAVFSEYSAPE